MSKIVVIEPHRILQQGIAIALYPENEVELLARVPENFSAESFDAAIVDCAALREANALTPAALRTVQDWKLPTIWIEDAAPARVADRTNGVTLHRPLARQALLAAVLECLGAGSTKKGNAEIGKRSRERAHSSKASAKGADKPVPVIVELTEVVEEGAADKKDSDAAGQKK